MVQVLITGVSGVGKSTVIRELQALTHRAVDVDDPAWSHWIDSPDGVGPSPDRPGQDWVWREDRIVALLAENRTDTLFVSGCSPNQGRFHQDFDRIILLSAPVPVMIDRLTHRVSNDYGKSAGELARCLEFKDTVEPLLRAAAHTEIDTSAPLDQVVAAILRQAGDNAAPQL